jgi:glucosamine--fructose-6-phosphate aminotransferase (isomerizing)
MSTHIHREITDQPHILRYLLTEGMETARTIANAIRRYDPTFVMIVARGTSDNAGRYAQYLLGIRAGLPVGLAAPSIHTLYEAAPRMNRALVIGISQSGQSEDVRRVIADAREDGALTVSITNAPGSPIADAAEYHLPIYAGEEISIAATKSYTAQLTAIAMLTTALVDDTEMFAVLDQLPTYAAQTLDLAESAGVGVWAERYRYMRDFATLGRGLNFCTAFEISLKIKELCYVTGVEYSEADFRHGPIALVQPGYPVILIAPNGKPLSGMVDLLGKLKEKGAEVIVISNEEAALSFATKRLPIPSLPEWVSPICAVIPGQLLAMNLALAKGHNVDKPIGLTKVTVTI